MKRTNIIFTAINILAVITMLILVGYEYFTPHLSTPPYAAFLAGCFFVPPLVLTNGIWLLIRKIRGEVPRSASNGTDPDHRRWLFSARLNAVFILLNILLAAVITIHGIIYTLREGGAFVLDFVSVIILYGVPFVLINDAWVVVSVNMKDRLAVSGKK